nr:MAG TPA: hypothetical protein [Caudoviricetes sp.]
MKKLLKKIIRGIAKFINAIFKYALPISATVLFVILMFISVKDCIDLISVTGVINNKIMFPIGGIIIKMASIGIDGWLAIKCIEIFGENLENAKK